MSLEEFKKTFDHNEPPAGISPMLKALWFDAKDDWEKAHDVAQDILSIDGSWIHAYLHRKEGDQPNASYWYSRAHKPTPNYSLQEEWLQLAEHFLKEK
jgi:hypothetical protein